MTRGGPVLGAISTHFIPPGLSGYTEAGGPAGPHEDFVKQRKVKTALVGIQVGPLDLGFWRFRPGQYAIVPADENAPFDVADLIEALVDADSWLEVHDRWAKEVVVGFARLDGRALRCRPSRRRDPDRG